MTVPTAASGDDALDEALRPLIARLTESTGRYRQRLAASPPEPLAQILDKLAAETRELAVDLPRTPWALAAVPVTLVGTIVLMLTLPVGWPGVIGVLLFWLLLVAVTVVEVRRVRRRTDEAQKRLWAVVLETLELPQGTRMPEAPLPDAAVVSPTKLVARPAPRSQQTRHQRPTPRRGPQDPREAEHFAAAWMRDRGCRDARVTQASSDGGVDVMSSRYVAQVKFQVAAVGGPVVQQIFGVAQRHDKLAVFFTSSRYTAKAVEFAEGRVALFVYDAAGSVRAANAAARQLLRDGLR